MVVIVNSVLKDVLHLGPRLRAADKKEIKAFSGLDPEEALHIAFESSDAKFCKTAFIGDLPIALFGVSPSKVQGVGYIWMLGSKELASQKIALLKQAKPEIQKMLLAYPILTNVVSEANIVHIKWLAHLGAKFIRRYPTFGIGKVPAYHFMFNDIPLDIKRVLDLK